MKVHKVNRIYSTLIGSALLVPLIAGCSEPVKNSTPVESTLTVNAQAVAAVPDYIKEAGELKVRFVENSPPGSFKSKSGVTTGWEVELAQLLGERMGLPVAAASIPFDQVIPAVMDGMADMSLASMFDTPAREELVDFVNYFEGGTGWATYADSGFQPSDACGKNVGARSGTAQFEQFLPAKSAACVELGNEPIQVTGFSDETAAADALKSQEIDAFVADSPVVSYLVGESVGRLTRVGNIEEIQPYGIAVGKGNEKLETALRLALNSLIADGTYFRLLGKWGVESGAVTEATTNAGSR